MAASDTCVPKLYGDEHALPANRTQLAHNEVVRSIVTIVASLMDVIAVGILTGWIYRYSPGPAMPLWNTILIGTIVAMPLIISPVRVRSNSVSDLIWIGETERDLRSSIQSQFVLLCLTMLLGRHLPVWAYLALLGTIPLFRLMLRRSFATRLLVLQVRVDNTIDPSPARSNFRLAKRIMDISVALLLLIVGGPLLLLIAVFVKLDSCGPVLFRQQRVGRNGRLFGIYKFRSMHTDAPRYELSPTATFDARITRAGRILRRSGLDELPQLINVLRGEMSLVGPRPEMPFLVKRHIDQHRARLQAIPGITGLWQLSKDRAFPIHENPQYDQFYIRNRTCCMDLAILIHTAIFAMRGGV